MKNILNNWNIKYNSIKEVQKNVWSIDKSYFLKANKNQNWVRNLQVYRALREIGIPTPDIVCTMEGKDYLACNGTYYFLTRKLKGVHLCKEEVMNDLEVAYSVGQVIAKLHRAFFVITDQFTIHDNNFINELKGWVKNNLQKCAVDSYTNSIFDECVNELELVYEELDRHLIHRDMHLGNLLFTDNQITGYIDFDLSHVDVRIFDIAYFLAGWIVGKVKDGKFMDKWKQTVHVVLKGYQNEEKLSAKEVDSLGIMMCCIEVLFVAYHYNVNDSQNALEAEECVKWLWVNHKTIASANKR